jgi:hypothetical protein
MSIYSLPTQLDVLEEVVGPYHIVAIEVIDVKGVPAGRYFMSYTTLIISEKSYLVSLSA